MLNFGILELELQMSVKRRRKKTETHHAQNPLSLVSTTRMIGSREDTKLLDKVINKALVISRFQLSIMTH